MKSLVLFHSILGLRPVEHELARIFAGIGYQVTVPDLFGGKTATSYEDGFSLRDQIGDEVIQARAMAALGEASPDAVLAAEVHPLAADRGAELGEGWVVRHDRAARVRHLWSGRWSGRPWRFLAPGRGGPPGGDQENKGHEPERVVNELRHVGPSGRHRISVSIGVRVCFRTGGAVKL